MIKKVGRNIMSFVMVLSSLFVAASCSCKKEDKDVTTVTRNDKVKELGDNVDKVPNATEVGKLESDEGTSLLSNNDLQITVNPQYFELSNGYNYAIGSELERFNSNVNGAKSFKDEILTITPIKQYNIWVDRDYYSLGVTSKVKVNYDVNLDMLTMEKIYIAPNGNKTGTVYEKIVSSYDVNGNIVIDSFRSEYHDNDLKYENSFHYNENVIFSFAEVEYMYSDSQNLGGVHVTNSVTGNYKLAEFILEDGKEQTSLMTYSATKAKVDGVEQTFEGAGAITAIKQIDGYNVVFKKNLSSSNKTYETIVFDAKGHTIGQLDYNYTNDNQISIKPMIAMYLLEGYDGLYKDATTNNYYLLIDGNKYDSNNLKYEDLSVYLSSHVESLYISHSKEENITQWVEIPVIKFVTGKKYNQGSNFSIYDYLTDYFDTLGLSFKDASLGSSIEKIQSNHDLIDREWSAFGLLEFENIKYDVFAKMFNEYKPLSVNLDAINALNQETSIMIDEQQVDTTQYQNIAISDEVEVTINSNTGEIDLSNINIEVAKKQLFSKGNKYRLVVALTSATNSIELAYKEVTFDNASMSFSEFGSVACDAEGLKDGEEYTLSIYLAGYTSEGFLRMTNDIKVKYNNFSDFEISQEVNDENIIVSYTYTDKLIVEIQHS